jgi:hypothetical protein
LKDTVLRELADFSPQRIMKETESVESMMAQAFMMAGFPLSHELRLRDTESVDRSERGP